METVNNVLKLIESFGSATGFELYLKAALAILSIIGGIYWTFLKVKARIIAAEKAEANDRQNNIEDNVSTEDQNSSDGQSVRDRLRRNSNDSE